MKTYYLDIIAMRKVGDIISTKTFEQVKVQLKNNVTVADFCKKYVLKFFGENSGWFLGQASGSEVI